MSCLDKWNSIGPVTNPVDKSRIKSIHIYDFDNTLFRSPSPNPNFLAGQAIRALVDCNTFSNGGWWADNRFLEPVVQGWLDSRDSGEYFNEDIVTLSEMSHEDASVVSILLTGRKEAGFAELVHKVVESRGLHFNAVCLKKPGCNSTIEYKIEVISDLLNEFGDADEITIYDDRPKQLERMQRYLNEHQAKRPFRYILVPVPALLRYLDPGLERDLIARVIAEHNAVSKPVATLKESVLGSSYILDVASRCRVVEFIFRYYKDYIGNDEHINFYPRSILASRGKVSRAELAKIDNLDSIQWKMTHFGYKRQDLFVAKLAPVVPGQYIYTQFAFPLLVMAWKRSNPVHYESVFNEKITWMETTEELLFDTAFGLEFQLKIQM